MGSGCLRTYLMAVASVAAAGCGGALTARGEVPRPAQVPVQAFPRILIVASSADESSSLADGLARHLATSDSEVERLDRDAVAARRQDGRLHPTTIVLEVAAELEETDPLPFSDRDSLACGPGGCFATGPPVIDGEPTLQGRVVLTVLDGPSGRVLQRATVLETESGNDVLAMRLRVMSRLSERAVDLIDQRPQPIDVELSPVDNDEVEEALVDIAAGRWHRGRERLEGFVRSADFDAMERNVQARVLYNLGQARRFDREVDVDERLVRAERALRAAVRRDPKPDYARALRELEEHRASIAMVRAQEAARVHNFALRQRPAGIPTPPSSYR